jgi:LIVCS family branched-chain amino acid:cation transporter
MKHTKRIYVFGFALFAGFFGAGNLILPPQLGFSAGPDWWLVAFGFIITTTVIPLLSIFGHAKLQGTMLDFGKKISPKFSLFYCVVMYLIIVALPSPRTAAVTHELAIEPIFGTPAWLTSVIYFSMVLFFVLNRSKALNFLGKYLTPVIVIMVLLIIILGLWTPVNKLNDSIVSTPFTHGFIEGYQTYDALAGMVMGGVIIISLNAQGFKSYSEKRKIIMRSGLIAMVGLFVIYAGLIALGAHNNAQFEMGISRTELLLALANNSLGEIGATFVSILVALACFTTAVAITVSIADFFKALFNDHKQVYPITAFVCCLVGVVVGSYDVGFIIDIALPALMFIYPISMVLIFLNVVKDSWATPLVYKLVVLTAFIFSIPDFLQFFTESGTFHWLQSKIPLAGHNLGWLLPSLVMFFGLNLGKFLTKKPSVS